MWRATATGQAASAPWLVEGQPGKREKGAAGHGVTAQARLSHARSVLPRDAQQEGAPQKRQHVRGSEESWMGGRSCADPASPCQKACMPNSPQHFLRHPMT